MPEEKETVEQKDAVEPEEKKVQPEAEVETDEYGFGEEPAVATDAKTEEVAEDQADTGDTTGVETETETETEIEQERIIALDPALVAKAEALGFTRDDFQLFDGDGKLQRAIDVLERKSAAVQPSADRKKADEAKEAFKVALSEDDFPPELIAEMQRIADHYATRDAERTETVKQINETIATVRATLEEQSTRIFVDFFDAQVAELGEGYKDLLGSGSSYEMDAETTEGKNRARISQQMERIRAGRRALGESELNPQQTFQQAVTSLWPDKIKASARNEIAKSVQKRSKSIIARPTSRKTVPNVDGHTRAVQAAREIAQRRGVTLPPPTRDDRDTEYGI